MKAALTWNYDRYLPLHERERMAAPYVCRIVPSETAISFDFLDFAQKKADCDEKNTEYSVIWRLRDAEETYSAPLEGRSGRIDGLLPETDYAFRVVRNDGVSSDERLARTGRVPGIVVNYLHPDDPEYAFSGRYLCSPSLIRLPDGTLLASMDLYASGAPQNLTLIYRSVDDGRTWSHLTELCPCFWGKRFLCGGALYMIGCSTEYGDLLIGRSDDGGANWTAPTAILRGGCHCKQVGWHRAPMPVLIRDDRCAVRCMVREGFLRRGGVRTG